MNSYEDETQSGLDGGGSEHHIIILFSILEADC